MPTILIISGAVVIFVVIIIALGYVKASPDTAYIISGLRKKPKFLIGKAGIRVPFLEKKDELKLQLIPIDVKTSSTVPTADYINIKVDAAVNVKISDEPDKLLKAAQNFLNKKTDYIGQVAREVLEGNMREIVGQMRLEEMVCDRQKFAEKVKENADPDLARMGLDIVSFNVQNFVDDNQVIENLGVDNIVKIQKGAAIARAEAERDIAKARAVAQQESNSAEVASKTAIAEKNNELEIRQAELKKASDIKKAESDAAYKIQEEEQRKTVEVRTIEADIARQEQEVILNKKKAEVREQQLEAEIKKKADADLYSRQKAAEAAQYELQRQSEAKLFQTQKDADAQKYKAEQEAAAIKAKATAEADAIRVKGESEASAIQAKAVAEAEGIEKKALAMQKMNEAAILEMYFKAMPEIARNIAEPLTKVDHITMYGDGNSSKLTGDIIKTLTQVSDGIMETTGLDIKGLVDKFGKNTNNVTDDITEQTTK